MDLHLQFLHILVQDTQHRDSLSVGVPSAVEGEQHANLCVVYTQFTHNHMFFCTLTASLVTISGHLPHSIGTLGHWFRWSWIQGERKEKLVHENISDDNPHSWLAEFRISKTQSQIQYVHINLTSSWLAAVSSLQWLQATFLN